MVEQSADTQLKYTHARASTCNESTQKFANNSVARMYLPLSALTEEVSDGDDVALLPLASEEKEMTDSETEAKIKKCEKRKPRGIFGSCPQDNR